MTLLVPETHMPSWLTTVLRPAGELDAAETARLVQALEAAARSSDLLVVDVQAVHRLPRAVRRALRQARETLEAAGGALVLVDPDGRHAQFAGSAGLAAR